MTFAAAASRLDAWYSPSAVRRLDPAESEHDALLELLHYPDRTASRDHAGHDKYGEYDHDGFDHCHQPLSRDTRLARLTTQPASARSVTMP
jgi:hypothetical protein